MNNILCARTHEYVVNCEEYALIGITDLMISQMEEVNFVEFPDINSYYAKKEVFATIEGNGVATELYMPIGAKVIEINPLLLDSLDTLNSNPLTDGWLVKIEPYNFQADIYDLSDYDEYKKEF